MSLKNKEDNNEIFNLLSNIKSTNKQKNIILFDQVPISPNQSINEKQPEKQPEKQTEKQTEKQPEKQPENKYENIYPNLSDLSSNNFNIKEYENVHDMILCNYVFRINNQSLFSFTEEQNKFKNDILVNYENERFINNETYDPWIFEKKNTNWPSFITDIYYTHLTPNKQIVRLSYSTNCYLNTVFKTQTIASCLRLHYYPIYQLATELMREPTIKDIQNKFINKTFIHGFSNIELLINSDKKVLIQRDFGKNNFKELIKIPINQKQPTNWAYKNFYDYIPVCFIPQNIDTTEYPNLLMSNICYHENNCHDTWCSTHNYTHPNNFLKHKHNSNNLFYKFKTSQILDIKSLLQ